MVSQDVLAQLRQDITTAEDAGDKVNAARLRGELAMAEKAREAEVEDTGEVPGIVLEPPD